MLFKCFCSSKTHFGSEDREKERERERGRGREREKSTELQEKMEVLSVSHSAVTATRLTQLPIRKLGSFQQCRRSVGVPGRCRAEAGDATNLSVAAERPLWLPGSTPPAYLNGSYVKLLYLSPTC